MPNCQECAQGSACRAWNTRSPAKISENFTELANRALEPFNRLRCCKQTVAVFRNLLRVASLTATRSTFLNSANAELPGMCAGERVSRMEHALPCEDF